MSTHKELHEKIEAIMTNHLPHLAERVAKVEGKVDLITKLLLLVAGLILGLYIKN